MDPRTITPEEVLDLLEEVKDPEVPVISARELGVLLDVAVHERTVEVTITPTYSGCPAMDVMRAEIERVLHQAGVIDVRIKQVLSPAWSTDRISETGKRKLLAYGIAPPPSSADVRALNGKAPTVQCPHCGSTATMLISMFGSTACKALYKCTDCLEPFDLFKCL